METILTQSPSENDILAPHMHAYGLGGILDVAEQELGAERVRGWLDEWGVDVRHLIETQAWVSWEFCERVLARLAAEGGIDAVTRVGRAVMSPKHMGAIYPFVRSFGTPTFTYDRIVSSTPRFNKVVVWEVERKGPRHLTLTAHRQVDIERTGTGHLCEVLRAQMASVPVLFDLPPARVDHSECYHRGGEECVFDIAWREPTGRRSPFVLLLGGALAGSAIGWLLGATLALSIPMTVLGAVATWATTLAYRQRLDLADRVADIQDHHDALTRSVRDNEARFEELLAAKREVDLKVQERTAELLETGQALARTLEEVRALDMAKTDFFSNVSHELRTPLTLMLAPLGDLAAGREPPGGTSASLGAMERNGARLLTLINQLLELAKIDAGAATLQRVGVRPKDLVERIAEAFRPAATSKGVTLLAEYPESEALVELDAERVESALINLVANALRFTPEGGRIALRAEDVGAAILFSVEDDGIGIGADEIATLFDRFSQAGPDRGRVGGTGIGLALVREAARLHGGDVTVESDPGVRTAFTLRLPRVAATRSTRAAPELSIPLADAPTVSDAELTRPGPGRDAPVALVVEDNHDLRVFLADILAARFRVHAVGDGVRALELAPTLLPDVVVSDVNMPRMDGLALTRALRELVYTRTTPVVLVTARGDIQQVIEGFDAGADDYITKPFHGRELLARVDVHLRIRRLMQHLAHQERLASLGVIAASVAHNVRNALLPLTSGLPSVRRRLSAAIDEGTAQMFDVMQDSAARIERLSIDLLDLSRIEKDQQGLFQPGAGLMSSVRLISVKLDPTVELTLDVDEETTLWGRAGDMNHVFLNLIDNAAHAVAGQKDAKLHVSGARVGDDYVIEVCDSGHGVTPNLRELVFDAFVTTRSAGAGTGLGLAIARDVVQQHQGTIRVDTAEIGGARFTLVLPIRAAAPPR